MAGLAVLLLQGNYGDAVAAATATAAAIPPPSLASWLAGWLARARRVCKEV